MIYQINNYTYIDNKIIKKIQEKLSVLVAAMKTNDIIKKEQESNIKYIYMKTSKEKQIIKILTEIDSYRYMYQNEKNNRS